MVLGDGCQVLVEQELEAIVVRLDDERAPPEVRPPVPHCLDKTNQLTLVCRKGGVTRSDSPAEIGNRTCTLV